MTTGLERVIDIAWALALAVPMSAAAKDYVCIPHAAAGFRYNRATQQYQPTAFKVKGEQWVIRTPAPSDTPFLSSMLYAVYRPGSSFPQYWCELPADANGVLRCLSGSGSFEVNFRTQRYLATYSGYWTDLSEGSTVSADSPRIEIGKCSKLEPDGSER